MNKKFLIYYILLIISCLINVSWVYGSPNTNKLFQDKNFFIKADKLYYNKEKSIATGINNVEVLVGDYYFNSQALLLDLKNQILYSNTPTIIRHKDIILLSNSFIFSKQKGITILNGIKLRLNESDIFISRKLVSDSIRYKFNDSSFTSCRQCINNSPIWEISAYKTELDREKQTVTYKHAFLKFGGKSVLYLPYFSHPTPESSSKSGILRPEIENDTAKIPFYLSLRDNMDFTYSPKFNRKLFIHEFELRHLLQKGNYTFNASTTKNILNESDRKKKSRYFLKYKGNFSIYNNDVFFNLSKVSDKSYLKNYYEDDSNYLKSEIYSNYITNNYYARVDIAHYQGLRSVDKKSTDPTIFPNLRIQKDYDFSQGWKLKIKNIFTNYYENNRKNISRNSLLFDISKNYHGKNGEILNYGLINRTDFYMIHKSDRQNYLRYFDRKYSNQNNSPRTLVRHIPEFYSSARVPHDLNISSNRNFVMMVEPQISMIIGLNNIKKIEKHNLIDSPNIEVNDHNLFKNSRYSGIDYHEFGKRINYGISNYIISKDFKISAFIGQALSSNNDKLNSKSNYVGKVSFLYKDIFEIYYKFQRKNKNFKPNKDEIITWLQYGNFYFHNNLTILRNMNISDDFSYQAASIKQNIIKQNYSQASVMLNNNTKIFGDIRFDLTKNKNNRILSSSVGIDYKFDCLSVYTKISTDNTSDPERNIKKTRGYSLRIGLKSINI